MRISVALAAVAALSVAGCQSTGLANFFGTNDPCQQAEVTYTAFLALSGGKVSPQAKRAAAAGITAVREQCSDGSIDKITLNKLVRAYVVGLEAWKKGEL